MQALFKIIFNITIHQIKLYYITLDSIMLLLLLLLKIITIMLITIIKHNSSQKLSITTVCFESFRVGVGLHIIWYSILNSI